MKSFGAPRIFAILAGMILLAGAACISTYEEDQRAATLDAATPDATPGTGLVDPESGTTNPLDAARPDSGTDGTLDSGPPTRRLVFVTAGVYRGNLAGDHGVGGADRICAQTAAAAGLPGSYLAWIADATRSPASRFTKSEVPYVTVEGTLIARDWAALLQSGPQNPITMVDGGGCQCNAWTAVKPDGTFAGNNNCNDWTAQTFDPATSGPLGRFGDPAIDFSWTAAGEISCSSRYGIYCFQQ